MQQLQQETSANRCLTQTTAHELETTPAVTRHNSNSPAIFIADGQPVWVLAVSIY